MKARLTRHEEQLERERLVKAMAVCGCAIEELHHREGAGSCFSKARRVALLCLTWLLSANTP